MSRMPKMVWGQSLEDGIVPIELADDDKVAECDCVVSKTKKGLRITKLCVNATLAYYTTLAMSLSKKSTSDFTEKETKEYREQWDWINERGRQVIVGYCEEA